MLILNQMDFDPVGSYSRPDILYGLMPYLERTLY